MVAFHLQNLWYSSVWKSTNHWSTSNGLLWSVNVFLDSFYRWPDLFPLIINKTLATISSLSISGLQLNFYYILLNMYFLENHFCLNKTEPFLIVFINDASSLFFFLIEWSFIYPIINNLRKCSLCVKLFDSISKFFYL